jgi:hypothetical protein
MAAPRDPLVPADVVVVGETTLLPDLFRPVAALVTGSEVRWATWADAPLPERAVEEASVLGTPTGAWVVYHADDIDGPSEHCAVHLGPGGVTAAVALGTGRPVGADEHGLWVGDPRDASMWMDSMPTDDADSADGDGDDVRELDPETLPWSDAGPFWPDPATWSEPLDEEEDDDELVEDDDDPDGGFVWTIGFGDDADERADAHADERTDPPAPPAPTPPTDLVLIRPDGDRTVIRVDHLVEGVRSEDGMLVVGYFPTGPRRVASGGSAWDVVYEPREVRLDVTDGLPETITTEDLPSVPAVEAGEDDWEQEVERREAAREPWLDRFDLTGVPGTRWASWSADEASRERTVARLRAMFEDLDAPSIVVWSRTEPHPRRIRSAYRDVRVSVEGDWPMTEVVVSFEHTDVPFLRLRRRYRVFDDAGHPIDPGYATVYLEEDIATGAIPPRSAAVDGVLDI